MNGLSKKNQKLLKKCIEHWYENLMMLQLNKLSTNISLWEDVWAGEEFCAFCQEYFKKQCEGCFISIVVGETNCFNTPFEIIRLRKGTSDYDRCFRAISEEINFLISLGE